MLRNKISDIYFRKCDLQLWTLNLIYDKILGVIGIFEFFLLIVPNKSKSFSVPVTGSTRFIYNKEIQMVK